MKTIGEKIKEARIKKGLSQTELAEQLGYKSRSSINKIEVGGRDIPRSQIVKIAQILDVTPAFLMGWEDEPTNLNFNTTPTEDIKDMTPEQIKKALEDLKDLAEKNYPELAESFMKNTTPNAEILSAGENIYKIPVFSSVSAGFGAYACSDVIDYLHLYIANPADVPEMLCIKVTGDSMYPKIEDGDIIVVRKQDSVDSGSIAVVLVDGEEGFVKKVIYDNETIELVSINPEYAPKIFKGAEVLRVRVVGIVKQVIKTL